MDALSPGWASVRVPAWLSSTGAAAAATVMWLTQNGFVAGLASGHAPDEGAGKTRGCVWFGNTHAVLQAVLC